MASNDRTSPAPCHYFVDEAGDPILFNRRKQLVVGNEGCSRYFILGLLEVGDPDLLASNLAELRARLLADPYLLHIESMKPARRKTALAFHAKDDCPEVRREVYRLLVESDVKFFAVVRDKRGSLSWFESITSQIPRTAITPISSTTAASAGYSNSDCIKKAATAFGSPSEGRNRERLP